MKPLDFNFKDEMKYGNEIIDIISAVRGEKTNNNTSLKTLVKNLSLNASKELISAVNESIKDFKATLFIENLDMKEKETGFEITNIELDLSEEKNN